MDSNKKKYVFNRDSNLVSETIGVSEERFDELQGAAKKTVLAAVLTDEKIDDTGKALEMLINEGQPKGEVEAMILGYMYGKNEQKMTHVVGEIDKMIGRLSGR